MAGPFDDGVMHFAPDLRTNIDNGDANYLSMLDEADAYIARNGLDLPEEPQARVLGPDPDCVTDPAARTRPRRSRRHLDHLGDRLRVRLRLAAGRRVRRERRTRTPARRFVRARTVLPRTAVAVAARIELHLGRVARRQIPRRPDRDPAQLPRLQGFRALTTRTLTERNAIMIDIGAETTQGNPQADPALQHQGHLPRTESRQRPLPGRRRRRCGLSTRADRPGSRHPGIGRHRRRRRSRPRRR